MKHLRRVTNMASLRHPCPCHSGLEYEDCCKIFHSGVLPDNALRLMKSRYAAYALNIPDYIIKTTHPACSHYSENKFSWKRSISQFAAHTCFLGLEILDFKENERLATVTFTVKISQDSKESIFTEKSYFEKIGDQWLYRSCQLSEGRALNLVGTGPFNLLPLAYYGDPILTKKGDPITKIDEEIKNLVEKMIATMDACDGIGLAAPQIHHSLRLFVIRTPIEKKNTLENGEVQVFINPVLSLPSVDMWAAPEGCLSIPSIRAEVERPKEITITYETLEGIEMTRRVSGWEARVILHEYDHIEGILFIDRLGHEERSKLNMTLSNLQQRIQKAYHED